MKRNLLKDCKHTGFIDYDEMNKLEPEVKKRIEDYLTSRMREETDNKFSRNIVLEDTDGIVELYEDENGEPVYQYMADSDYYVFVADIIFAPKEVEEVDFGTSLSEWL